MNSLQPNVDESVVIAGGGHAGSAVAACLRQLGYNAPITLISEEDTLPYHRPPLSKAWLRGAQNAESLLLRPSQFYGTNRISVRLGVRVASVDRYHQRVALSDGTTMPYTHLVLATGARARRLTVTGHALRGVFSLRSKEDATALRMALSPGRRLVVVGAGYVGLEAAATARALGVDVVVIEREPVLMARTASSLLASRVEAKHREMGVEFVLQAPKVECFAGRDGQVAAVVLADGREMPCDAVLVGIGAEPNDALAREAGLACEGGVVVDACARTSDKRVYAVGDVSCRPLRRYNRSLRLESVANALEQARQAAGAITGRPAPEPEVPWFWSDQYDYKLQIAGLRFDVERSLERFDVSAGRYSVFHLRNERLIAVEAVNAPHEFLIGKKLIAASTPVDPRRLADPSVAIKELFSANAGEARA
ncbi:NAD(P)/FAD-dependent oxidoreductase [Burkholderia cepacia]|uniref:NAD(P)/FAD-dependent oxidoreductase n=1 Tax=Burkholderia cepacia TaxID=292 RepID=UPI000AB322CE|nr:FAD-dependent oxidoreductase [Burkholderia cepacia]